MPSFEEPVLSYEATMVYQLEVMRLIRNCVINFQNLGGDRQSVPTARLRLERLIKYEREVRASNARLGANPTTEQRNHPYFREGMFDRCREDLDDAYAWFTDWISSRDATTPSTSHPGTITTASFEPEREQTSNERPPDAYCHIPSCHVVLYHDASRAHIEDAGQDNGQGDDQPNVQDMDFQEPIHGTRDQPKVPIDQGEPSIMTQNDDDFVATLAPIASDSGADVNKDSKLISAESQISEDYQAQAVGHAILSPLGGTREFSRPLRPPNRIAMYSTSPGGGPSGWNSKWSALRPIGCRYSALQPEYRMSSPIRQGCGPKGTDLRATRCRYSALQPEHRTFPPLRRIRCGWRGTNGFRYSALQPEYRMSPPVRRRGYCSKGTALRTIGFRYSALQPEYRISPPVPPWRRPKRSRDRHSEEVHNAGTHPGVPTETRTPSFHSLTREKLQGLATSDTSWPPAPRATTFVSCARLQRERCHPRRALACSTRTSPSRDPKELSRAQGRHRRADQTNQPDGRYFRKFVSIKDADAEPLDDNTPDEDRSDLSGTETVTNSSIASVKGRNTLVSIGDSRLPTKSILATFKCRRQSTLLRVARTDPSSYPKLPLLLHSHRLFSSVDRYKHRRNHPGGINITLAEVPPKHWDQTGIPRWTVIHSYVPGVHATPTEPSPRRASFGRGHCTQRWHIAAFFQQTVQVLTGGVHRACDTTQGFRASPASYRRKCVKGIRKEAFLSTTCGSASGRTRTLSKTSPPARPQRASHLPARLTVSSTGHQSSRQSPSSRDYRLIWLLSMLAFAIVVVVNRLL